MRLFLLLAALLLPVTTQAQPDAESRESTNYEMVFGATLLGAGYTTSVIWSYAEDGDQDMLYIPLLGPWLELFTLPDCENDDVFCAHSNATRAVLISSGAAQLIGTGMLVHAIVTREKRKSNLIIAPSYSNGPGVSLRGIF